MSFCTMGSTIGFEWKEDGIENNGEYKTASTTFHATVVSEIRRSLKSYGECFIDPFM